VDPLITAAALTAFLAAWTWVLNTRSGGRLWHPLWLAFGTSALAGLFIVAGSIGYILSKHARFVAGTAWSGTVIWWEVWTGVALVPLAAFLWRRGVRSLGTR
jgi:hypothetical protein